MSVFRVVLIIIALNLAACADMRQSNVECAPPEFNTAEPAPSERFQHFENRLILWLFTILTYPFVEKE